LINIENIIVIDIVKQLRFLCVEISKMVDIQADIDSEETHSCNLIHSPTKTSEHCFIDTYKQK